ncbi:MAG: hypothetical protein DMG26_04440 [Acidobacteria bacterium]|nr:MAG: hypothetical protein DMG26_04440 [Acidobacteriota bacterium]
MLSSYRRAYWKFLFRLLAHWLFDPRKFSLGFAMLLSGHHFIRYASSVVGQLESELNIAPVSGPRYQTPASAG